MFASAHDIGQTQMDIEENKVLTIPETPPSSKGLLPSLSTTRTANPVIINYNNKRACQVTNNKAIKWKSRVMQKELNGSDMVNHHEYF